jgi:hypothetical protein
MESVLTLIVEQKWRPISPRRNAIESSRWLARKEEKEERKEKNEKD